MSPNVTSRGEAAVLVGGLDEALDGAAPSLPRRRQLGVVEVEPVERQRDDRRRPAGRASACM